MKHRRRLQVASVAAVAPISPLEPRRLLHSFTLTDGVLKLDLTDSPEELNVALDGDKIRATLKENGVAHDDQAWTSKSVKQINILARGGDDLIKISKDVKQSAVVGGFAGNDTIYGGGGNDTIGGTDGNDFIDGGPGADSMIGGGGYDVVSYETRTSPVFIFQTPNQSLDGEKNEHDSIFGDITEIRGGSGNDVMRAGNFGSTAAGNKLVGNGGNDTLTGGARNDTLWGGSGNDNINGGKGDDSIKGDSGADKLVGSDGRDSIDGGSGKDSIYGGSGIDTLYGGADRDSFWIADGYGDKVDGGSGNDVIKDKKDKKDSITSIVV